MLEELYAGLSPDEALGIDLAVLFSPFVILAIYLYLTMHRRGAPK